MLPPPEVCEVDTVEDIEHDPIERAAAQKIVSAWQGLQAKPKRRSTKAHIAWQNLKNKTFELSWENFVQGSTVHGIKYIFEDSPFKWRKLLWIVLVIGTSLGFMINACVRSKDYFDYKTTVDVQVKYSSKSMPLPTITICNENNFRLTKVVELELYEYIDYIFSLRNMSAVNMSLFHIPDIQYIDFITKSAHQAEKFISKCLWKGKTCDIHNDFKITYTDVGVCLSFNTKADKYVGEPGVGYGLSIVLNVEQYEYMRGPQTGAGVKVLLHDAAETPLMGDMGFSVAPGTKTLVAIKRSQISSLVPPYGDCIDSMESVASCRLNCRKNHVYNACNCTLPYMNKTSQLGSNIKICNISTAYTCVRTTLEKLQGGDSTCQCTVPCKRINYEPTLSYSHISKYNVERVAFNSPADAVEVTKEFLRALEISQRTIRPIRDVDNKIINSIYQHGQTLLDLVLNASIDLSNSTTFSIKHDTFNLVDNWQSLIYEFSAYSLLNDVWKPFRAWSQTSRNSLRTNSFFDSYMFNYTILNNNTGLIPVLTKCINGIVPTTTTAPKTTNMMGVTVHHFYTPMPTNNSKTNRTSKAHRLYKQCPDKRLSYPPSLNYAPYNYYCRGYNFNKYACYNYINVSTAYQNMINKTFRSSRKTPEEFNEHHECLRQLEHYDSIIVPLYDKIHKKLEKLWSYQTLQNLLNAVEEYIPPVATASFYPSCIWLNDYYYEQYSPDGYHFTTLPRAAKKLEKLFLKGQLRRKLDRINLRATFNSLQQNLHSLSKLIEQKLDPLFSLLILYENGTITKATLAENVNDMLYAKSVLSDIGTSLKSEFKAFLEGTTLLSSTVIEAFQVHLNLLIKGLTADKLKHFTAVRQALNFQSVNYTGPLKDIVENLTDDNIQTVGLELFNLLLSPYTTYLQSIFNSFNTELDQLNGQLGEMHARLTDYKKETTMDSQFYMDNFIQLDIYYKELSYQIVKQQEAFPILSLLSEIGGFLGLLLGASILTIFELMDYLILSFYKKWQQRKVKPKQNQQIKM